MNKADNTTRRTVRAIGVVFAASAAGVIGLPGVAQAHVTVQPGEAEAGGFSVVAFRVPNERDDAGTTKLRVILPEDQPVGSVRTTPVPGWTVTTKNRTLDEPIEMFGEELSEVVSQVTWTATGDGVAPGQFQDFDLSLGPLPESGEMVFKALQTYSSGEQVNWNEVSLDESVEPEHPAPVLTITPAADEEAAAEEAAAEESATEAATRLAANETPGEDTESVVPMTLSAAALLVSLGALMLSWKRRKA